MKTIRVYHIALKNGRCFDFEGLKYGRDISRIGNHIVITVNGCFRAAFDLSEVAFAVSMEMLSDEYGHIARSADELKRLQRRDVLQNEV